MGGGLSGFGGSGTNYTVLFTPTPGLTGPGSVSLSGGSFRDAAGNTNTTDGYTLPLTVDMVAPTVVVSTDKPSGVKAGMWRR